MNVILKSNHFIERQYSLMGAIFDFKLFQAMLIGDSVPEIPLNFNGVLIGMSAILIALTRKMTNCLISKEGFRATINYKKNKMT